MPYAKETHEFAITSQSVEKDGVAVDVWWRLAEQAKRGCEWVKVSQLMHEDA